MASAIASGSPPAWRVPRSDAGAPMRQGGRGLTVGHHRLRAGLVVLQVRVALVPLAGAGLLIHSFVHLLDVNPEQRQAIYRQMRDQLLAVPGVVNVAAVSRLGSWLFVEGKTPRGEQGPDNDSNPAAVALIDETAARKFWPREDAVGKRIKLGANPDRQPWTTIALNPMFAPILVIRTEAGPAALIHGLEERSTAQRTQRIGVRMALGASPAAANRMILREGLRLTAAGIAAGSVAALGFTRLMRSMLFEVQPLDPGVRSGV